MQEENINNLISQIRAKGFTLSSLAEKMGTSKQNLNGKLKSPSFPTLIEIADALGVPLWQLFAPQSISDLSGQIIALVKKDDRFWFASTTDELRRIADEIDSLE